MAKARTVESLKVKRAQVQMAITAFETRLIQAKADLSHLDGAIAIFEASGDRRAMTAYAHFKSLWKPRQLPAMVLGFLKDNGPMTSRELGALAVKTSGMDSADPVLVRAVINKVVYVVRGLEGRNAICRDGKRDGVHLWALAK